MRDKIDSEGRGPVLSDDEEDEFPPITDEMLATACRGEFAESLKRGSNVVTIDPDLRELFPTERAVNDALRSLIRTIPMPEPSGLPRRIPAAGSRP